jgi:hypothetical protein
MPTVLDLAIMAKAVYKDPPEVPGWKRLSFRAANGLLDGFQAAAFSGPGGIVIAFRGSAQGEDWAVNGAYAVGMNTTRFSSAEDFTTKVAQDFAGQFGGRENIYITGHSLGGAITQIVANRQGYKFVTFNAPGVAVLASRNVGEMASSLVTGGLGVRIAGSMVSAVAHPQQAYRDAKALFRKVNGLNVCLNADMVSRIGVHYGKVVRIPGPSSNPLTAHYMESVLKGLQGDPAANLPSNPLANRSV